MKVNWESKIDQYKKIDKKILIAGFAIIWIYCIINIVLEVIK
jgi:hypothetical protein